MADSERRFAETVSLLRSGLVRVLDTYSANSDTVCRRANQTETLRPTAPSQAPIPRRGRMNQGEAVNINIPTHTNINDTSRSTSNRKKLDLNRTEIRASVRSNKNMVGFLLCKSKTSISVRPKLRQSAVPNCPEAGQK